jgi:hypothetical protein
MQRREFLRLGGRALLGTGLLTGLSGCETMDALSNTGASLNLGQVFGPKVGAQAESALRITGAAASASEQLNPEQEYYLGRTVAAHVLTRYEPFELRPPGLESARDLRRVSLSDRRLGRDQRLLGTRRAGHHHPRHAALLLQRGRPGRSARA